MRITRLIFSALLLLLLSGCGVFTLTQPANERAGSFPSSTIQGYDVLALAKYCKTFLNAPPLPAMSTLLNTFGDPLPCVQKRINKGGMRVVQIDIRDATCFRNGVCPKGTPPLDDWQVMRQGARQINKVATANSTVQFWVSPWLEHDIKSVETIRKGFAVVAKACPTCKLINSPVSGARPPEFPLELHGTKVRAFSVSGDGASMFDGDNLASDGNGFQHRASGSFSTFGWWNELNLRCTGEEHFTPVNLRTNLPTPAQFEQAYYVLQPEAPFPPNPPQCKSVRVIAPGAEIVKTNAEAYCNGQPTDSRGNKPLLIIKQPGSSGERRDVLSSAGQVAGCFKYYGTYGELPGTHRWYMGNCSGQNPVQLMKALKSEWGFLKLNNGNCLRFNAIRRQGTYR